MLMFVRHSRVPSAGLLVAVCEQLDLTKAIFLGGGSWYEKLPRSGTAVPDLQIHTLLPPRGATSQVSTKKAPGHAHSCRWDSPKHIWKAPYKRMTAREKKKTVSKDKAEDSQKKEKPNEIPTQKGWQPGRTVMQKNMSHPPSTSPTHRPPPHPPSSPTPPPPPTHGFLRQLVHMS